LTACCSCSRSSSSVWGGCLASANSSNSSSYCSGFSGSSADNLAYLCNSWSNRPPESFPASG
jgi:hypothetical protein